MLKVEIKLNDVSNSRFVKIEKLIKSRINKTEMNKTSIMVEDFLFIE